MNITSNRQVNLPYRSRRSPIKNRDIALADTARGELSSKREMSFRRLRKNDDPGSIFIQSMNNTGAHRIIRKRFLHASAVSQHAV
jgi:hypothetical protein